MVQDPLGDAEGLGDRDTKQEVANWLAGDAGPRALRCMEPGWSLDAAVGGAQKGKAMATQRGTPYQIVGMH